MNLRNGWVATLAFTGLTASAQAPLLQDGATALRQARLDWASGLSPLGASSLPSFEAGLGGAGSDGVYAPLSDGEGLGRGTQGWGLGLQGRYVLGGLSFSATLLALRDHGNSVGVLQRASLGYQWESGWRVALEQAPFAWGAGLNGGDLLGDSARPFHRWSLATPEAELPLGRWRLETFAGRLGGDRPIPEWISQREARHAAQTAGLELEHPSLWGGWLRASFGPLVEASLGTLTMDGGRDGLGRSAPPSAARTESLGELRIRIPAFARLFQARGASLWCSRSGSPDSGAMTLNPARNLGGLQLVWEGWDLGLEYAGAAPLPELSGLSQPAYFAGFSNLGDPLGPAFGLGVTTRTVELGLPLFLDGQGRVKAVRATAPSGQPDGTGSWFIQSDAQWRTSTGRLGVSVASRRNELPNAEARWGWAFSVFQAFRVF